MQEEAQASKHTAATIAFVVSFHISIALLCTLFNKVVLRTLPTPNLLLVAQSFFTIFILYAGAIFKVWKAPVIDIKRILIIRYYLAIRVAAQITKLYCLQNVDMSFYQISRGLLLPLTIVLSWMALEGFKISKFPLAACILVTFGFALGVNGERLGQTSTLGIMLGIISSFGTAAEVVAIKICVSGEIPLLELVFSGALVMLPVCLVTAWLSNEIHHFLNLAMTAEAVFASSWQVIVACITNFLLSIAALLQIKTTSPTTHMICTAARGVLQSLIAVLILGDVLAVSRIISLTVIVVGTCLYTLAKEMESRRSRAYEPVELREAV